MIKNLSTEIHNSRKTIPENVMSSRNLFPPLATPRVQIWNIGHLIIHETCQVLNSKNTPVRNVLAMPIAEKGSIPAKLSFTYISLIWNNFVEYLHKQDEKQSPKHTEMSINVAYPKQTCP